MVWVSFLQSPCDKGLVLGVVLRGGVEPRSGAWLEVLRFLGLCSWGEL
jgi:hypothetical protein